MEIYLPLDSVLYPRFKDSPEIFFYNAPKDLPSVCGGRIKSRVYHLLLTNQQIREFSESLGPRFNLLATNSWAEYSPQLGELCKILSENGSSLVVARRALAEVVRERHPNLGIHASCIMSIYQPWEWVINNPLFNKICAPQWWNYDLHEMTSNVPEDQRNRVYFIINSMCKWGPHCRGHYENSSLSYLVDKPPPWHAPHETPFPAKDGVDMAIRSSRLGKALLGLGFTGVKLQGRGDRSRDLIPIVLSLQGLIRLPDSYSQFEEESLRTYPWGPSHLRAVGGGA